MDLAPYTIRIFVAHGDPDGVRLVDSMNWAGMCLVVPRRHWLQARTRREFDQVGVYILFGRDEKNSDLPKIYLGEGDGLRERIDHHYKEKDFWDLAVAFTSPSNSLHKAHVQWLESSLLARATKVGQAIRDNLTIPRKPGLSESEIADVEKFLSEMLKILPLVSPRVFDKMPSFVVSDQRPIDTESSVILSTHLTNIRVADTIIVPAQKRGFQKVFLGEDCWHAVRISPARIEHLKYIAAYQTGPVSAITHTAKISRIEPYGDKGKSKIVFAGKASEVTPIPFAKMSPGSMQGPRYADYARIVEAKCIADIFDTG